MRFRCALIACLAVGIEACQGGSSKSAELVEATADSGPDSSGTTLELGYYEQNDYRKLVDGGDCPIVYGLQGGTWTMPAVRFSGLQTPANAQASLRTASGETVGVKGASQSFSPDGNGFAEIMRFPIPILHAAPREDDSVDDLYGQQATLSIVFRDNENREASETVQVVLRAGTL